MRVVIIFTGSSPESCTAYPCLLFEDNFDYLDVSKWKHEITLGGGGVRS
jgi:hypothetical protein